MQYKYEMSACELDCHLNHKVLLDSRLDNVVEPLNYRLVFSYGEVAVD